MLYRPNYCCQCGEKIARTRWTPWTSRRFCEFCEIEQKQHDLLPKAGAIVLLLIGVAGITSYVGSGGAAPQIALPMEHRSSASPVIDGRKSEQSRNTKVAPDSNSSPASTAAAGNSVQRRVPPDSSTEPVYFCGAITKKGTPCTRRVKTKGRCWQHAGLPAQSERSDRSFRP
jgi:hypothetical protein